MYQSLIYRLPLAVLVVLSGGFRAVENTTVHASKAVVVARRHRRSLTATTTLTPPPTTTTMATTRHANVFTEPSRVASSDVGGASAPYFLYLDSGNIIESSRTDDSNPNVPGTVTLECSANTRNTATFGNATAAKIQIIPTSVEGALKSSSPELQLLESSSTTVSALPLTNNVLLILASLVWLGWTNTHGVQNLVEIVVTTFRTGWHFIPSVSWTSVRSDAASAATLWLSSSTRSSSITVAGLIQIGLQVLVQKFGHRLFSLAWTRFEAWLFEAETASPPNRILALYHTRCTASSQWWWRCSSFMSMIWGMVKQNMRKVMVQTMVQQMNYLSTETLPAVLRWTRHAVQQHVQWLLYTR